MSRTRVPEHTVHFGGGGAEARLGEHRRPSAFRQLSFGQDLLTLDRPGGWPERPCAWKLISDSTPADSQSVLHLHADADGTYRAIGDPQYLVGVTDLLNDEVVFIGELATIVEIANVVLPGKALYGASSRYPWPAVLIRKHPPGVQSSRCITLGVQNEADIRDIRSLFREYSWHQTRSQQPSGQ